MNDRVKMSGATVHTPDYDLHDWAYDEQCRREDCRDAYVSERLEELKTKVVAFKAPDIFESAIENMDSKTVDRINRWLFLIWQCRNPFGEAGNSKYAVSIIADLLHDALLKELDEEAKEIID